MEFELPRWFYEKECSDCPSKATDLLPTCCQGRQGGRFVSPSCDFRYEIVHFYSDPAGNAPTPMQPSPKPQSPTSQEGLVIVSPPPPATYSIPRKEFGELKNRDGDLPRGLH
ncbi:hypothetical protein LWI29_023943 [Acer saccharum]|uniref:Gnk2-homologous domain-containing protein n=1 Tax=Acer saccharum TaxID=4024 RepID=A0AA39W313_ACESA|nr:hypothetical protein LWI29_023943 [Acer saccharum]